MTNAEDVSITEDKPEADVAEQQIPVDLTVDETGLDPTRWRPDSGVNRRAKVLASVGDVTRWR